jgi:hypothetical protein
MNDKQGKILKILFEKLKYFNYSERTIETYVCNCSISTNSGKIMLLFN